MRRLTKKRKELLEKYGKPMGYLQDCPVLKAIPRIDWPSGWRVFCQYCLIWHLHGIDKDENITHRLSHCANRDSPYKKTGYYLKKIYGEEKEN